MPVSLCSSFRVCTIHKLEKINDIHRKTGNRKTLLTSVRKSSKCIYIYIIYKYICLVNQTTEIICFQFYAAHNEYFYNLGFKNVLSKLYFITFMFIKEKQENFFVYCFFKLIQGLVQSAQNITKTKSGPKNIWIKLYLPNLKSEFLISDRYKNYSFYILFNQVTKNQY